MYSAFNFKVIEKHLKDEFKSRFPRKSSSSEEENSIGFLTIDNFDNAFKISHQDSRKRQIKKVVGILFADPGVTFARSEVIPQLDYLHHLTGRHLEIFCAGYNAYLPPEDLPKDSKKIEPNVGGTPWEFSTEAYLNLEKKIESISSWQKGDGCSLLLFSVTVSEFGIDYDFRDCLDWNLITMIQQDKAVSSVRKLLDTVVKAIESHAGTWETSDKFGLKILQDGIKQSVLSLLPKSLEESYKKAEHFAVRNFAK